MVVSAVVTMVVGGAVVTIVVGGAVVSMVVGAVVTMVVGGAVVTTVVGGGADGNNKKYVAAEAINATMTTAAIAATPTLVIPLFDIFLSSLAPEFYLKRFRHAENASSSEHMMSNSMLTLIVVVGGFEKNKAAGSSVCMQMSCSRHWYRCQANSMLLENLFSTVGAPYGRWEFCAFIKHAH